MSRDIPSLRDLPEPSAELVVKMCKHAPAPMDNVFGAMAIPTAMPDWLTSIEFVVLMGICGKFAQNQPISDEDWEKHEEEINTLIEKGLVIESFEKFGEVPQQVIPTLYCSLCCISLTEPFHWEAIKWDALAIKPRRGLRAPFSTCRTGGC
jgi:hypothetical protein